MGPVTLRIRLRGQVCRLLLLVSLTGAALVPLRAVDGATPLIDAVKAGDRAAVRQHVDRKADINAAEPDGTTALQWAVRADDREIVALLLRRGARPAAANRMTIARRHGICGNCPTKRPRT